jgi:hypothetical protein
MYKVMPPAISRTIRAKTIRTLAALAAAAAIVVTGLMLLAMTV